MTRSPRLAGAGAGYTRGPMTGHSHHALDDRRMRRLLGYQIALAAIPTGQVFETRIGAPLQLKRVEYTILVLVDSNADTTQKQLSRALRVSVPYLTVTIDRLRERGLLTRVPNEVDRRSQFIRLTREGAALLKKADAIAEGMEGELLSVLTPAERAMLFELLHKVALHHRRA